MKNATKQTKTNKQQTPAKPYHPAFGTLSHSADLGIGILVAEDATGAYEILGPVATINEGIEVAGHDFRNRLDRVERGEDPMHVEVYKVWCRNYDGEYSVVFEIRGDIVR